MIKPTEIQHYILLYTVLLLEEDYTCYLEFILAAEVLFRQCVIKAYLLTCKGHSHLRESKRNKWNRETC